MTEERVLCDIRDLLDGYTIDEAIVELKKLREIYGMGAIIEIDLEWVPYTEDEIPSVKLVKRL